MTVVSPVPAPAAIPTEAWFPSRRHSCGCRSAPCRPSASNGRHTPSRTSPASPDVIHRRQVAALRHQPPPHVIGQTGVNRQQQHSVVSSSDKRWRKMPPNTRFLMCDLPCGSRHFAMSRSAHRPRPASLPQRYAHRPRVSWLIIITPDILEQQHLREHGTAVFHQQAQQLVLKRQLTVVNEYGERAQSTPDAGYQRMRPILVLHISAAQDCTNARSAPSCRTAWECNHPHRCPDRLLLMYSVFSVSRMTESSPHPCASADDAEW